MPDVFTHDDAVHTLLCCLMNEPWHDKTNKMSVRPAKTQINLGIRSVWSEFYCPHEESLGP